MNQPVTSETGPRNQMFIFVLPKPRFPHTVQTNENLLSAQAGQQILPQKVSQTADGYIMTRARTLPGTTVAQTEGLLTVNTIKKELKGMWP